MAGLSGARAFGALLLFFDSGEGCSNFIASKGATKDGSTQLAYNSDGASFYGYMEHLPAGHHPPGAQRHIWEYGTGRYMGSIPEAKYTYNVIGMMNEHQLSIGETTFGGLESLESQPGAVIDYYSLIWITLQRAKTAREAIATMDALTQAYGYASSGESFSLIDPNEAWVMDFIGRGPGRRGAVWVARRVPDGYVGAHANQARIRTFPWDSNDTLYSPDIIQFAKSLDLYRTSPSGNDKEFSFADTFDPLTPAGARLCEARVWDLFRQVAGSDWASQYLDYAQGKNLSNRMPLFVKAPQPLALNATMWLTRSHYEGSWFDARDEVLAGPFHSPYPLRQLVFKENGTQYALNRNVGDLGTFFHFVSQARGATSDLRCAGGITWFGVDDASSSARVPMYACTQKAPETYAYGHGDTGRFSQRAAFWAFNLVANFAYSRWDRIGAEVQRRVVDTELRLLGDVAAADTEVERRLAAGEAHDDVSKYLSDFSVSHADALVDSWVGFFPELFVKFRDYLECLPALPPASAPPPGSVPASKPGPPQCRQVGYDAAWKKRLVKELGDHYLLPAANKRTAGLVPKKLAVASIGIELDDFVEGPAAAGAEPQSKADLVDEAGVSVSVVVVAVAALALVAAAKLQCRYRRWAQSQVYASQSPRILAAMVEDDSLE